MPWPPIDDSLLAANAATWSFSLGRPVVLAVAPDGAVLYRRTPPRSFQADLYVWENGAERRLVSVDALLAGGDEQLSAEEKARRERTRTATRGVVDIDLSRDGRTILVPLGGRLFLVDRASGVARALELDGEALDPRLSPDASRVAFVRGGAVWWAPTAGGPARRLTTPAHPDETHGAAEFVAQEELHRTRGWWWSPKGSAILFQRTDERPVATWWVADARDPARPPTAFRYPRAGTANAVVDLGLVPITGGEPRWFRWDLARWPYLAHVDWSGDGPVLLQVLDRDQAEIALLALDVATGQFRTLLVERDPAWINLAPGNATRVGEGFLWMTERSGAWTLHHHAADGSEIARLTPPELGLRAILGLVDRDVLVSAATDPRQAHVWRVPLDGGRPVPLTSGGGLHTGFAAGGRIVLSAARPEGGVVTEVHTADGLRQVLPSVAERPAIVPTTVFETVTLEGRIHHCALTRPRAFTPGRRYPVLMKVYGGPHAKTVHDTLDTYLVDQFYADAGFIVIRSDNRGTPDRGRDWERAVRHNLVQAPLDDQVGALQALGARHAELDLGRVGIFGWSFGGYLSAMAVLLRPDVFHAAVAGAPVTDWSLYDTAYTERYMGTPQDNPEGYRLTSALTHAAGLSRPLLVLHGLTDDNVYFAHTVAFVQALYMAGHRVELVPLSGTHMVPDPAVAIAKERVHVAFFREKLGDGA